MNTRSFRGSGAVLFIWILLTGTIFCSPAFAYRISYSHYLYAPGGGSPEVDDGHLNDGPLSLFESITFPGEPMATNEANVSYFADIDAGKMGAFASAAGDVTNFWPFGFTATGRVLEISFNVTVHYLVPAGNYPAGLSVSASGRVSGSFAATYAAGARGQYTIQLGAGHHSPPLTIIENDDDTILHVDDPFLVTHQIVSPGTELSEPTSVPVSLSASFSNFITSAILEGTSPSYITGSAENSFYSGLEFTEMTVPDGVTWTTDTGQFFHEEYTTDVADTPQMARLEGNYPNPFNPSTNISYFLAEAGPVNLSVFDVSGKLIRILEDGSLEAGAHQEEWEGLDQTGNPVPSGIYLYTLEAGSFRETRKMMLVR